MFSIMDKYNVFTVVTRCGGGGGGSSGGNSEGRARQQAAARRRSQSPQAQRSRDVRQHVFSQTVQGTSVFGRVDRSGPNIGIETRSNCTNCHHPRDPFAR